MPEIPSLLNDFNVYSEDDEKYVGLASKLELPELSNITETVAGAGLLGEFEDSATGQFESATFKLTFSNLLNEFFRTADTTDPIMLTCRGVYQHRDRGTARANYHKVVIIVRGISKTQTLGSWEKGKKGEPELELELYYIKVTIDGVTELELDKLNYVFILHGKDLMEPIRAGV